MTRRIAVTGANGFVGRAIVAAISRAGATPRSVVRRARRPGADGELVSCELADPAGLRRAFAGCDAVVHAAGLMRGSAEDLAAVNVTGTRNVLAAAVAIGARAVFLSTVAVYGEGDMLDVTEDRPLRPRDTYARTKAEAEEAVRRACAAEGLEAWVLRPTTVYGPGDERGFTPFLLQLGRAGVIPLVAEGEIRFDLVASQDVARACHLAATGPAGRGEALHVTSGEELTVATIVERLRRELGLPAPCVRVDDPRSPPDGVPLELVRAVSEHRGFSIDRARARLGYEPRVRFPAPLAS